MSEAKFSKGPWRVVTKLSASENHKGFSIYQSTTSELGLWALADIQPGDEDGELGRANAALIAAAPALYSALEEMATFIRDYKAATKDELPYPVLDRAEAALKKARGE